RRKEKGESRDSDDTRSSAGRIRDAGLGFPLTVPRPAGDNDRAVPRSQSEDCRMRTFLTCGLVLVLALPAAWAADIDSAKLVGRWVPAQMPAKAAASFTNEFTKDGKYSMGETVKLTGTYTVEGNKLTVTLGGAAGVPPEVKTYTITKLTDTQL